MKIYYYCLVYILEAGCIFVGDLKLLDFSKVPTTLLGFLFYNVPETIQGYGLPGKNLD